MKPLSSKKAQILTKQGNADVEKAALVKQTKFRDVDERSALDRLSDTLIEFAKEIKQNSKASKVETDLIILRIVEALQSQPGLPKIELPKIEIPNMNVDITETRPKNWKITVTNRDYDGRIAEMKIEAEETLVM